MRRTITGQNAFAEIRNSMNILHNRRGTNLSAVSDQDELAYKYQESPSKLDLDFDQRHNSNSIGPMGGQLDDPFGSLENPIDSIDQIDLMNEYYDKANEAKGNKTTTNFFKGSKQQLMKQILDDNNIKKQRSYIRSVQKKSNQAVDERKKNAPPMSASVDLRGPPKIPAVLKNRKQSRSPKDERKKSKLQQFYELIDDKRIDANMQKKLKFMELNTVSQSQDSEGRAFGSMIRRKTNKIKDTFFHDPQDNYNIISNNRQDFQKKDQYKNPQAVKGHYMDYQFAKPKQSKVVNQTKKGDLMKFSGSTHKQIPDFLRNLYSNPIAEESTIDLIKKMIEVHIDARQLNNIRMGFLKLDSSNRGVMNIFEFEKKLVKTFLATCPYQQVKQFVDIVRDQKNESMINFERLSSFIDLFQYFPYVIKKDKNFSEDVYFALSSNKAGNAMTFLNDTLNNLSARQADIKILLDYFWLRIQTKFIQVAQSFRFFDLNSDGQISYNEFCVGLQNLNMKLSKENSLKIFNYIDKAKSGFISYFEFCQLCEERRRGIDPYQPIPGHLQNLQKQKLNARVGVHHSFYKSQDGDQPIISTQLQAYKNLRVKKLPEKLNPKSFIFGKKTKQSQDIAPILNNEYAEKWLQKQKQKEEQYLNSQIGSYVASSLTSGSKKLKVFKHFHTKASRGMKQTQLKKFKEQQRSMEEDKLKIIHSRTIDSSYSFLGGDSSFGGVSQKGANKRHQINPYQLPIVKKNGLNSDKKNQINQSFNHYEYPKLPESRDDVKASVSVPPINQNEYKMRQIKKIDEIQQDPISRKVLTSMNTPQQQKMKSLVRGIYTPAPTSLKNSFQNDLLTKKKKMMMMMERQAQSVDIRKKSAIRDEKVDPRSLFKHKQAPIIDKFQRQNSASYSTEQMSKFSTKRRSQTAYMMSQTANSFHNNGSFLKQNAL